MKRLKFSLFAAIFLLNTVNLFAKTEVVTENSNLYMYNKLITTLKTVQEPQVTDDYIIFTEKAGPRFAGIVFDFEDYKDIHPFKIHKNYDIDGNVTGQIMFYVLDRPKELTEIKYRLIIDGLWTKDPVNPDSIYDHKAGLSLSRVNIGSTLPQITDVKKDDIVRFIYNGEPGLQVRLGGNFTNWDSWIYELKEIYAGHYELEMHLPTGKYYYNYYLGMQQIVDKTNPERAYTDDGRIASVLVVD